MTASSEIARRRGVIRRLAIPDIVGLHVNNATIVLRNAGFEQVRVHYVEDYAAEFSVVAQVPRAGLLTSLDREIELRVSRRSLINFLPQVFQSSEFEGSGSFLRGYLNIVQHVYDSVNDKISGMSRLFDPRTTDPEFLPWLGSWLAIGLNQDWSVLERRKMLMAATKLFPIRGTAQAIREFVRIYAGVDVVIRENEWPFQGFRVGVHSTVGEDTVILPPMNLAHCFVVELDKSIHDISDDEIVKIHQIIQNQKPAHTSYFLAFAEAKAQREMQAFMTIGMGAMPVEGGEEGADAEAVGGIGVGIGMGIGVGAEPAEAPEPEAPAEKVEAPKKPQVKAKSPKATSSKAAPAAAKEPKVPAKGQGAKKAKKGTKKS